MLLDKILPSPATFVLQKMFVEKFANTIKVAIFSKQSLTHDKIGEDFLLAKISTHTVLCTLLYITRNSRGMLSTNYRMYESACSITRAEHCQFVQCHQYMMSNNTIDDYACIIVVCYLGGRYTYTPWYSITVYC